MIVDQGKRYDYVAATRAEDYAFIYTYTGRSFKVKPTSLKAKQLEASWYDPKDGSTQKIGLFPGTSTLSFDPPGEPRPGNDWVLVLDKHA
jgi:hypothetical protein